MALLYAIMSLLLAYLPCIPAKLSLKFGFFPLVLLLISWVCKHQQTKNKYNYDTDHI